MQHCPIPKCPEGMLLIQTFYHLILKKISLKVAKYLQSVLEELKRNGQH